MNYSQFIESKILQAPPLGFECIMDLHPSSKPHQSDIIKWACYGGKRAVFANFGLGKTHIQLEIARVVTSHYKGKKALILCPLGVKDEFKEESIRLGIEVEYVTTMEQYKNSSCSIIITNYERVREGDIRPDENMIMVSLDEASCLRSVGSKTYIEFKKIFQKVHHQYVATATPSPNDYVEMLNYAAFLGIMDVSQAKTRFFKRNSEKADELELYPHKEREFWLWVSSWAIFITKPSDLGYSDEGYDLPELEVTWHRITSASDKINKDDSGQVQAFADVAADLAACAKVKRESITERVKAMKDIIDADDPYKHWLIWHHLEAERVAIENTQLSGPAIVTVFGKQPDELKDELLSAFAKGEIKYLATKPEIAGQGRNFQKHCSDAIFVGVNYKFNEFIQAIHRIYRFLQYRKCGIRIIFTEQEEHIIRVLQDKWKRHNEQQEIMRGIIKEFGLSHNRTNELKRALGVNRKVYIGESFIAINNDCVEEKRKEEDNAIDLIITSIPFSNQYEYSPNYNDFGHNDNNEKFFEQMDYLVPELLRTLKPGRLCCVHVKNRIVFGNFSGMGFPTVYRFSNKTVDCFTKHGFADMGEIIIPTDVVRENSQTYRLGWTENSKDGTKMGVGMAEYILLFRKPPTDTSNAYADIPVVKGKKDYTRARWQVDAHGHWLSSGNRLLTPDEYAAFKLDKAMKTLKQEMVTHQYDYERHVSIAEALEAVEKLPSSYMAVEPMSTHPDVWTDITRMRGLNTTQGQRRQEKHLCPLPFDIVNRLIVRYSNPGELVEDPFAGIYTVPFCAIKLGRMGKGIELNNEYWKTGVGYCKGLEMQKEIKTLF